MSFGVTSNPPSVSQGNTRKVRRTIKQLIRCCLGPLFPGTPSTQWNSYVYNENSTKKLVDFHLRYLIISELQLWSDISVKSELEIKNRGSLNVVILQLDQITKYWWDIQVPKSLFLYTPREQIRVNHYFIDTIVAIVIINRHQDVTFNTEIIISATLKYSCYYFTWSYPVQEKRKLWTVSCVTKS